MRKPLEVYRDDQYRYLEQIVHPYIDKIYLKMVLCGQELTREIQGVKHDLHGKQAALKPVFLCKEEEHVTNIILRKED